MATIIRQYQSDFGITYVQTADCPGVEFNFDHTPTQAEIDAAVATFVANNAPPVETIQLVGEDGTTV